MSLVRMGLALRDATAVVDQRAPSEPCECTNDCPTPRVCNEGLCRDTTPCTVDTDCELGSICNMLRGRCVLGCRNARQCPDELVCDNYQCVDGQRCTSDRECAPNEECSTGRGFLVAV